MINRLSVLFFFSVLFALLNPSKTLAGSPSPADSIKVRWIDGKKFILHKVEPKETWSLLAKKYKCDTQNLKDANKGVVDLKVGQIINVPASVSSESSSNTGSKVNEKKSEAIPTTEPTKQVSKTTPSTTADKTPVYYTVKPKETLYSISKKFEQSIDNLKAFNNLTSNAVKEGQKLIVNYTSSKKPVTAATSDQQVITPAVTETRQESKPEVKEVRSAATPEQVILPPAKTAKTPEPVVSAPVNNFDRATKTISPVKKGNGGKTLMQVAETGVATWIQDGQLNQDKYYGLHRSAPIGTIIKVTNRMNNQFVYVKIVGVLPDTGENDNVIIKVSQAVKGKLNALDPLFQVELSYGIMQ
ncbi:MAG TPA: LysM peptidoglycan-binding domain-containing protein [Bacteroidia bacterium]|nr:LysM peptidoglycan-binding domain-containing protein [Bacteroidia bacterium]